MKSGGQAFQKLHPCCEASCHAIAMCPTCKASFETGEWLKSPDLVKVLVKRSLKGRFSGRRLSDVTIKNHSYSVMRLQAAFGIGDKCQNIDGKTVVSWHIPANFGIRILKNPIGKIWTEVSTRLKNRKRKGDPHYHWQLKTMMLGRSQAEGNPRHGDYLDQNRGSEQLRFYQGWLCFFWVVTS